jgi:outer membrane protein OmpA-like peptidoglycan-associated protein
VKSTCAILALLCLACQADAQVFTPHNVKRPPKVAAEPKPLEVTQDEEGCVDSPVLARVAGCVILQCGTKQDDTLELFTKVAADGDLTKTAFDGSSEVTYYLCKEKVTPTQILKQAETTLVEKGYQIMAQGSDGDDPIISARKGDQWVQVATYVYDGRPAYIQSLLQAEPEEGLAPEAIEEQLSKGERVVLSGLTFGRGREDLTPENEKLLTSVSSLLAKRSDWKLTLEAFAFDAPDKMANQGLSDRRAAAVAEWLTRNGIPKERIQAVGRGDSTPGEGPQRIEIVKQ